MEFKRSLRRDVQVQQFLLLLLLLPIIVIVVAACCSTLTATKFPEIATKKAEGKITHKEVPAKKKTRTKPSFDCRPDYFTGGDGGGAAAAVAA